MDSVSKVARAALVLLAAYCALMIDWHAILQGVVVRGHYVGDFTVFWTAARADPRIIFDIEAITRAQDPLLGGAVGPRPFVNPPSFLPWLKPFSWMPFFPALAVWSFIGVSAFAIAARQLVDWRHYALILIAPAFVLAFVAGQATFFLATAVIVAILTLERRPILAGVLLGLTATIKPQVVLLAPLALMAGGHWRALLATLATGILVGVTCVLVQGVQLWLAWLEALKAFAEIAKVHYLINRGATPTSLAHTMGLEGPAAMAFVWVLAACGVALVFGVFRASRDHLHRLTALIVGSLLCVPYAMPYETVPLLIPASIWLMGEDRRRWFPGFMMISQLVLPLGVIASGVLVFWESRGWRSFAPAGAPERVASEA